MSNNNQWNTTILKMAMQFQSMRNGNHFVYLPSINNLCKVTVQLTCHFWESSIYFSQLEIIMSHCVHTWISDWHKIMIFFFMVPVCCTWPSGFAVLYYYIWTTVRNKKKLIMKMMSKTQTYKSMNYFLIFICYESVSLNW